MRTGDIAKILGVSPDTVRNWIRQFTDFISDRQGMQQSYTEEDLKVLATVAKLRADNFEFDEITKRLSDGYRVEKPSLESHGVDLSMVPRAAVEQIVDSTGIRVELEKVKSERDRLAEMFEASQQEIRELNQQIRELERKLGQAEGELHYRRQLDEKGRRDE